MSTIEYVSSSLAIPVACDDDDDEADDGLRRSSAFITLFSLRKQHGIGRVRAGLERSEILTEIRIWPLPHSHPERTAEEEASSLT